MLLSFFELLSWWQPEAAAGGGGGAAAASGGGAGPAGPAGMCGPGGMNLGLLAVMFLVFYFLIIRPQSKRQRETEDMLKALRKGQVVRTSGGVRGEIVDLTDRDITLRIADKTKINVLRTHIAGPEPSDSEDES